MVIVSRNTKGKPKKKSPSRPVTWNVKKGRCKGGGQSSKAKGRAAVQQVRELLLSWLPLFENDIHVKATSQGGCDLHFSQNALNHFPFDPEVKNVEAIQIWASLAQAQNNAKKYPPVLFFKRSQTPLFIAMKADDFFKFVEGLKK